MNKIKKVSQYLASNCENKFVIFDCRGSIFTENEKKFFSHEGITTYGVDSALFILPSKNANVRMEIFENDGSESDMCGNGIICLTKLLNIGKGHIEMKGGIVQVLHDKDMYSLVLPSSNISITRLEGDKYYTKVGEPHIVMIVENIDSYDLIKEGLNLQKNFPGGINLDIIEKIDDSKYKIRTFERGVLGETKSCGTGSMASFITVNNLSKGLTKQLSIISAGGVHNISLNKKGDLVLSIDNRFIFIKELFN